MPQLRSEQAAWIFGIARNKVRQELDRSRKRAGRAVLLDEGSSDLAWSADLERSVLDSLASRAIYSRLSEAEQELFDLAYLRELTPQAAGTILGISVTAYTSRVNRLRKRIVTLSEREMSTESG